MSRCKCAPHEITDRDCVALHDGCAGWGAGIAGAAGLARPSRLGFWWFQLLRSEGPTGADHLVAKTTWVSKGFAGPLPVFAVGYCSLLF